MKKKMQQIVIFLAIEKIAIMYDFMIRGKHLYAVQCTHSGQRHTLTLIVLLSSRLASIFQIGILAQFG